MELRDKIQGVIQGEPHWSRGHLSNILDVRNCVAVSSACLMTRRAVFQQELVHSLARN